MKTSVSGQWRHGIFQSHFVSSAALTITDGCHNHIQPEGAGRGGTGRGRGKAMQWWLSGGGCVAVVGSPYHTTLSTRIVFIRNGGQVSLSSSLSSRFGLH
jgi:hypothetical protein